MLDKNIDKNINYIKEKLNVANDYVFRNYVIKNTKITLVFNESITNSSNINDYILKQISSLTTKIFLSKKNIYNSFLNSIPSNSVKKISSYKDLFDFLYNGFVVILFDNNQNALAFEEKANLYRAISQPMIEQTISGPKDSFNESYMTNIGLIRKRIKSDELKIEEKIFGRYSKNRIGIMYMDNIANKNILKNVKKKLDNISIDGILDSSYIKEIIQDNNSTFPTLETTERPDLAVMSLFEGRVLILVENSPFVIIVPTFFVDLFHAPEDNYQNNKEVTFTRIIRFISFIIAIALPAFYIAITTYNHETIPTSLLINFASQRLAVPFPAIIEALGMILVFEILRESDVRFPKFSGSAISILGAIVLGDAAVAAGIVSPIMLIIIATSSICSLAFSHIAMVNAIRLWKVIFMLFATVFGIPGIFMATFLLTTVLVDLDSLGTPYIYPLAPFNFTFFKNWFFKLNIKKDNKRSTLLTDKNYTRSKL